MQTKGAVYSFPGDDCAASSHDVCVRCDVVGKSKCFLELTTLSSRDYEFTPRRVEKKTPGGAVIILNLLYCKCVCA